MINNMKPNRCMDCPHRIANFMNRTCELTGKTIPLFSVPADCPLVAISKTETTSCEAERADSDPPCSECRLYKRFVLGDGVK